MDQQIQQLLPESKRNLKPFIMILVVVLILILGFGTALAVRIFDPLWNPFRPSPEKVVAMAFDKMANLKSSKSDIKFSFSLSNIPTSGSVDINIKIETENLQKTSADIEVRGRILEDFALLGETRIIGSNLYYKLKDITIPESLLTLSGESFPVEEIIGQWIKKEMPAQQIDQDAMNILLENNNIYSVKKQYKDEGGNYHYLLVLDNQKIKSLLSNIVRESVKNETNPAIDFTIGAMEGALNELLSKVGEIQGEIFIGKKDYLIYSTKFEKEIDLSRFDKSLTGLITIKADIENSGFNQPLNISVPGDAKIEDEVFAPIIKKQNESKAKLELNKVISSALNIYKKDRSFYNLSCLNTSIKPYCDNIKQYIGAEPAFKKGRAVYCSYIIISQGYYCIDNKMTGSGVLVNTNPALRGYCDGRTFNCPKQ